MKNMGSAKKEKFPFSDKIKKRGINAAKNKCK